jgi:hypothetical protein
MATEDPTLVEILQEQARALQTVIKEAQRIHAELTQEMEKLRHAGDQSAPNKKRR